MGFFSDIQRGFERIRADSSGGGSGLAPALDDRLWGSGLLPQWGGGMRITAETVKGIGCAQACVAIIGRNIAQFPLKVFSQRGRTKKLATNCPEYQLLYSRPNDQHTSFEFRQLMQGHFELAGNAYAEKVMDRSGNTQKLLFMHPGRVTPEVLQNGRMRYKYADPLTGLTRVLVQEQVFHLRNWSDDGYVGQSTIAMGRDLFGVALAAQDYTSRFFQNDATPRTFFQATANAQRFKSKEEIDEFRESWRKGQTGANRHKVAVAPVGWELKELGVKPNDAQLIESRKFSRIEICSIFGVPPHLVGEAEKAATYASVEQFNIMFAVQCILPRVVVWEQAIQRDILQDDTYQARFSMAALLRGDNASRTAAYAVAIQNGWMSQNDVRMLEDMDPIEDGDTYWRPAAWSPLGQLTAPQPQSADGSDGPGKELGDLESDDTKRAQILRDARALVIEGGESAVVHNAHVLAGMADRSPSEANEALREFLR